MADNINYDAELFTCLEAYSSSSSSPASSSSSSLQVNESIKEEVKG